MTPAPPDRPPRPPVLSGLLAGAARRIVRLVLRAHPRDFQRRYGKDVMAAVDDDLRDAASGDAVSAGRVATHAVFDAVVGLAAAPRLTRFPEEPPSMRTWMRDAVMDLRLGVRGFRREPGWCAAVVATLALGIGLNAAMFGVADRLLLSGPAHVHDLAHLRRLQVTTQAAGMDPHSNGVFSYAAYGAIRRGSHLVDGMAGYSVYADLSVLGRGVEARRVNRGEATASLFPLLGVTPAAGRFFTAEEDDTAAPQHVVVIGSELWQSEFGGRPDAVGRPIVLDNTVYTVVGVTPQGFTGPDLMRVDVWFPESLMGSARVRPNWTQAWNSTWMSIVVRTRPGVTDEQMDREFTDLVQHAAPASNGLWRRATVAVRPLMFARDGVQSMEARISTWLVAVAGVVLLIACANVANLLLARGLRRRREIGVRLALGADRGRLMRLLLAESLVLAASGGAAGLAIAFLVGSLMRAWLLPTVAWTGGPVNVRVLLVSAAISIATGLVVGLLPAWRASAPDVSSALKTGIRDGGGRRRGARATLTVIQAALCALLLVGSGLFVVSLHRVRGLDLGLQPDHVLTFGVRRAGIPAAVSDEERKKEVQRRDAFYPTALERLQHDPDVDAAALTIGLAFWSGFGEDIRVPGVDHLPVLKGGGPFLSAVTADYFKTVGTRIVRGRAFTPAEHAGTAPVAIVGETMARRLWPGKDAIGQCFFIEQQPACVQIVGIAADARHFRLQEDESLTFYIPFGQEQGIGGTSLVVRPRGDASQALAALRRQLIALDPSITYVDAQVLQDLVEPQVRPWELGATMFTLMGVLALVVAAVGLYSVMSYFVADRTHEIGVRMALGARPTDVAQLVVRGGLVLAVGGIGLGFGLALLAGRLVEPLLFQTSPRDPAVFAEVAAVLVAMAVAATVVPATRARRVNPVEAMREE